ncbi:MAG: xanthine dehydrogenase [Anaerolineaceae bacterium]|nr:xanthine dehydrogenase [Anaerolineaceae bacterium]
MADDHHDVYQALLAATDAGTSAALATIIKTQGSIPRHAGSKMLVYADGSSVGTVGGGAMESKVIEVALAAIADGQSRIEQYTLNSIEAGDPGICGGSAQIFIEPLATTPTLLVIGGGHVGKALAELGKWMGFRVVLSDDRPDYANPGYVADLDQYLVCPPEEIFDHVGITPNTYVAAVTRGLPIDKNIIPALLETPAAYIGLIGSRRRWSLTVAALKENFGLTDVQLARVHAPIGLELEAETPKEIALSIMAEITMMRRGGTGAPMQTSPAALPKTDRQPTSQG